MDVFVSYSDQDIEFVKKMCGILESYGITYWAAYEYDGPESNLVDNIVNHISQAKILLVFISKSSNQSEHVLNEVNCASMYHKAILPVVIDDVEISSVMEHYIASSNRLSYSQSQDFVQQFVDTIRSMIGNGAALAAEKNEENNAIVQNSLQDEAYRKKKTKIKIASIAAVVVVAGAIAAAVLVYPKLNKKPADGAAESQTSVAETLPDDLNSWVAEPLADYKYFAAEYEYYYRTVHNQVYNMSMQYESYGAGMGAMYTGFDCKKLPEDQAYAGNDYKLPNGGTPTWKQYFEYAALESLKQFHILEDLAEKDGFKVDEAVLNEAYASIDQMKAQLIESEGSDSFDSWLRENYGDNMDEKLLKEIVKRQTVASEYAEHVSEKYIDEVLKNNAKLEEEYKKNPDLFNCVDFRIFTIAPEEIESKEGADEAEKDAATAKAKEEAKKKADEMFSKITDEESFKKLAAEYATDEQKEAADYTKDETTLMKYTDKETYRFAFGDEAVNWLFDKDTKVNDKMVFENEGTYYVFYMVKTAYRDDATIPADVRHILYQFDDVAKDKEADKKAQKAAADAALNAINSSDDKLSKFIELCEKDSDDTGSKADGGLFTYIGRGKYVKAFEEWSLDPNRKVGDVGVIETEYGYHVMYFVQKHNAPMWKITLSQQIAAEEFNAMLEGLAASDIYNVADTNYITELSNNIYNKTVESFYADLKAN